MQLVDAVWPYCEWQLDGWKKPVLVALFAAILRKNTPELTYLRGRADGIAYAFAALSDPSLELEKWREIGRELVDHSGRVKDSYPFVCGLYLMTTGKAKALLSDPLHKLNQIPAADMDGLAGGR